MRTQRIIIVGATLVVALVLNGCPVGTRLSRYEPAHRPQGISCVLQIRGQPQLTLTGELLSVEDSAAIMVVNNKVWLVPYRHVRGSNCRRAGVIPFRTDNHRLVRDVANLHIRLSRYPQGVSPQLMTALLAAYEQPVLEVVVR